MRTPTAEEIVDIKAKALKRFGSDRARLVTIADPVDAAIVVAPFNLAAWSVYIDALNRDQDTANACAYVDRLLWPSLDEAIGIRKRWAPIAQKIVNDLMTAAGSIAGQPKIAPLGELPEGVGDSALADRIKGMSGVWLVTLPSGHRAVMKAPLSETYLASRAAVQSAKAKFDGVIATQMSFWRETALWCSEPLDALLETSPALTIDFWSAYQLMAGEGAAVVSKSL